MLQHTEACIQSAGKLDDYLMYDTGNKPWSDKLILGLGLVLVVFSLALAFFAEPKGLIGKVVIAFIAETGFACIIAVLIIWVVDRREKEEFHSYITRSDRRLAARNILAYTSDLDVPDALSKEIEHYLSATPFIKNFQNYIIEIKNLPSGETLVRFTTTTEYQNISRSAKKFEHEGYLAHADKDQPTKAATFVSFKAEVLENGEKRPRVLAERKFDKSPINAINYGDFVTHSIESGQRLKSTLSAEKIHPSRGSDFVRQKYLCCRMKFDFIYDHDEFNLETTLFCPGDSSASETVHKSGKSIEVSSPFLVNSGIVFTWARKS